MFILISDAFVQDLTNNLIQFGEVSQDKDCLNKADVVLIRSKTKVTKEYIDSAPNLKLVIRGGVGLDNVDLEYAKEKGIIVRNTPAASSIAVAELAFTLMICLPNHVVKGHNSMHAGEWIKKELKRSELYGKTLGILGLGRIGVELAKRAAVFGMKVIAYDPFVSESEYAEIIQQLTDVLNKADFVSMHMPLTDETEGIIYQSGKAYKELRKQLIENGLIGVITLPAGVFNPYSGVRTSILSIQEEGRPLWKMM